MIRFRLSGQRTPKKLLQGLVLGGILDLFSFAFTFIIVGACLPPNEPLWGRSRSFGLDYILESQNLFALLLDPPAAAMTLLESRILGY